VLLEKKPFDLQVVGDYMNRAMQLRNEMHNDIYGSYHLLPHADLSGARSLPIFFI
jgi:hypothetical protein